MSINLTFSILISYLIGTIPFSLIFTKLLTGKSPGTEGSGNYGALNSYEITGRKIIGFLVFICDFAKGAAAVLFAYIIIFPVFFYALIASLFVVIGHNFNIFLKFKGGRGLATALGAVVIYNPFVAIIWASLWLIFNKIVKKDILFSNKLASITTPAAIISAPDYIFSFFNYNFCVGVLEYKIFSIILCMLILTAHFRSKSQL